MGSFQSSGAVVWFTIATVSLRLEYPHAHRARLAHILSTPLLQLYKDGYMHNRLRASGYKSSEYSVQRGTSSSDFAEGQWLASDH